MHPNTIYDTWFELRKSTAVDDRGQHGAIRLRYSLQWTSSERRRLLAYAAAPPLFETHIDSSK